MKTLSHPISSQDVNGSNFTLDNLGIDPHPIILFEDYSGEGYFYVQARSQTKTANRTSKIKSKFESEVLISSQSPVTQYFKHQSYLNLANVFHISKENFELAFPNARIIFIDELYSENEIAQIFTKLVTFLEANPPYFKITQINLVNQEPTPDPVYFNQYYATSWALRYKDPIASKKFWADFDTIDNRSRQAQALLNSMHLSINEMIEFYNQDFLNLNLKQARYSQWWNKGRKR